VVRKLVAAGLGVGIALAFTAAITLRTGSPPQPSRAKPMQQSAFQVPRPSVRVIDTTPVRLVIASIGVDAVIEARGLDANRNLATPTNFRNVAWYKLGPRPGEAGNAIINGHVNWWTGDAVFTHLSRLKVGDQIRVVRADGVAVVFTVSAKRTVDANARVASLFAPSSTSTLTLITCSGVWNPLTQSDTQRLIVSASLA